MVQKPGTDLYDTAELHQLDTGIFRSVLPVLQQRYVKHRITAYRTHIRAAKDLRQRRTCMAADAFVEYLERSWMGRDHVSGSDRRIDQELYDAGKVDGAGRWQLIKNITIPSLMPTYFVMLMLSVANFLNNGMDQYYVFQNSFNKQTIQVLDLYVYNIGMTGRSLSLATAIGILKSAVSVTLLAIVNFVSKKTRGESII